MTCSFRSVGRAVALSGALIVLASSVASAQTAGASSLLGTAAEPTFLSTPAFAQLVNGKTVWITADGVRRQGHVTSVSTTSLRLVEDGAAITIPFDSIMRVEKSSHALRNGTLIGLAAGAGLGLAAAASFCSDEGCYPADFLVLGGFYGGLGAAAGVGIGAIVKAASGHGHILYDRRRTTTVSVAPILSPTRKGMAFSMSWR